jgi:hypothetical protein
MTKTPKSKTGERLKWARENLTSLETAEAAAKALHVKVPTHHARENGTRPLTRKSAEFYAKKWGVDASWLLYGTGTPRPEIPATAKALTKTTAISKQTGSNVVALLAPRGTDVAVEEFHQVPRDNRNDGVFIDLSTAPEQVKRLAEALGADQRGRELWQITSDALESFSYLPGDYLAIDRNVVPTGGKFVLATSQTIEGTVFYFRLYEPPYLISGSAKMAHRKPMLVDNVTNVIVGVVFSSARL